MLATLALAPDTIRSIAAEVGFDLVRFGPADPGEHGQHFLRWLAEGRHGDMQFLVDNQERTLAPDRWRRGVRSAVALAVDYGAGPGELPGGGYLDVPPWLFPTTAPCKLLPSTWTS